MSQIKVPMINERFSEMFSRDAANAAKKINELYGPIIKKASISTNVAFPIVVGFMIVENTQLKPDAVSYGCSVSRAKDYACAYGLMQMQVPTAFQTIKDQAPSLKPEEAAIINKYLPGIIKGGGFVGFLASWKQQIHDALLIPEFNIWIGTIHLAQLLKKSKDDKGNFRLDHVIVKYNRGIGNYTKEVVKSGLSQVDTAVLAAKLPIQETRSYITKFVGVDGAIMAALRNPFV